MNNLYPFPQSEGSFLDVLKDPFSQKLFGFELELEKPELHWGIGFLARLESLITNPANHLSLFKVGYACLEAFLQSNVTGPPLDFNPDDVLFPRFYHTSLNMIKEQTLSALSISGVSIYHLTPNVVLFWVAKVILGNYFLSEGFNGRRARIRVNFWHQKLLGELNEVLQTQIYEDAEILQRQLTKRLDFGGADAKKHVVEFLLENAVIDTYYGKDVGARDLLVKAAGFRGFDFVLTGALGKRTKFQHDQISQLVVLAKSKGEDLEKPGIAGLNLSSHTVEEKSEFTNKQDAQSGSSTNPPPKAPHNLSLNDDTLLESIQFSTGKSLPQVISDPSRLSPSLAEIDPAAQPLLQPLDSIILLQVASSVSNTSPSDGLTREETLPYATRVLDGGSSNWQVYTQALLVRSRIEGYRSRTAERGLLQLQSLVDQVIVETATQKKDTLEARQSSEVEISADSSSSVTPSIQLSTPESTSTSGPTSFLPAGSPKETAPVDERLKYIYQIHPPFRWELEAELANRWVSLGGLKTALDIYERLEMHAEVVLCLAATDNEQKAKSLLHKLLFKPGLSVTDLEGQSVATAELADPLPSDAPRLLCILGDIDNSVAAYERAWSVSKDTYARAQRSLGRQFVRENKYPAAAVAYAKSLKISGLNASTWFALGAVQLKLNKFRDATYSFTRAVQIEPEDAEAWNNLAAAFMSLSKLKDESGKEQMTAVENTGKAPETAKPPKSTLNPLISALRALRHAARLKPTDARIWDNYLTTAASIKPPKTPWVDIILALRKLIEIRGPKKGENAIDVVFLEILVKVLTHEYTYPDRQQQVTRAKATQNREQHKTKEKEMADSNYDHIYPFPRGSIPTQILSLIDTSVMPLLTTSTPLYHLISDVETWRHRPRAALDANEKAWRAVIARPAVFETEGGWKAVVDETRLLVREYEQLGRRAAENDCAGAGAGARQADSMKSGEGRELVEENWRFKAQSAIRSVLGKGRDSWEETEGWAKLEYLVGKLEDAGDEA